MKTIMQMARELAVKLQGLEIAKRDLIILNQAIKDGRPGRMADAIKNAHRWVRMADARTRVITKNIEAKKNRAFEARLTEGLAGQAKFLFSINEED